jgi:hypothetical protein
MGTYDEEEKFDYWSERKPKTLAGIMCKKCRSNPCICNSAHIKAVIAARDKWRIENTQPIIDSLVEFIKRGDYSNGNVAQGADEGEYFAAHHLQYLIEKWQQLLKTIGVSQ